MNRPIGEEQDHYPRGLPIVLLFQRLFFTGHTTLEEKIGFQLAFLGLYFQFSCFGLRNSERNKRKEYLQRSLINAFLLFKRERRTQKPDK